MRLRSVDVAVYDPSPTASEVLDAVMADAVLAWAALGLATDQVGSLTIVDSIAEAVDGAGLVQESVPERIDIKHSTLAAIDDVAPLNALIASSTSGYQPSDLATAMNHPERFVVAHPFNPVYLLPLVEVVAGEQTSEAAMDAAVAHYDDLVMHPLVVRNEIEGYLSDRLQEALWREVLHLVNDGVATTRELDDAINYGPGLRWAGMGTNLTFHLAGGEQGMRHMLRQFGPALKLPWTKLEAPELTDDLIEAMADGCEEQAEGRSIAELERLRDDYVISVMRSLRPLDLGAGRLIAEREARIHEAGSGSRWTAGDDAENHLVAAPLALYETVVEPDWVDYNGHMSEWAFLTAFGWASDKLFRYIGIDEGYRAAGHTFFTVETHLNYVKEASLGEPLRFTTQILGVDSKRLHFFHAMYLVDEAGAIGDLLCTTEQMLLHVDTGTGSTAPILDGPADALAAIAGAHANLPVPPQVGRVMRIPA